MLYVEVDAELFLYPAVQRLVDGVVRGLACPGHGTDDVGVLYKFVVGDRRIDASLVGVQHRRFAAPLEQAHHVGESVQILVAGTSALGDPVGEDLLGEHVEVEGDLEVVYPELEGCHVRHDHLPGTVNRLPRRVYQVRVSVLDFAGPAMRLVRRLGPDSEVPEALVCVVVADFHLPVDSYKGGCPAVAVRLVDLVHGIHHRHHLAAGDVAFGRLVLPPFVEARSAHAHH